MLFEERGLPPTDRSADPRSSHRPPGGAGDPGFATGADPTGPGPIGLADRFDGMVLRFELWRQRPAVVWGLVAVVVCVSALGWWLGRPAPQPPVEELVPLAGTVPGGTGTGGADEDGAGDGGASEQVPVPAATTSTTPEPVAPPVDLIVHVIGEVARPGLVMLAPGSRIVDAVSAAGGVTETADPERLNLAAPIADGDQVRVPARGEEVAGPLVVPARSLVGDGSAASPPSTGPIDLNAATAEQLETLPGVGPATSAAIIGWRAEHGGFLTVEDLTSVPGIGPAKLAALRDLVTV